MKITESKKYIQEEVRTLHGYLSTFQEKLNKGSRKDIKRWADKLEAQTRWISILVEEYYK